MRKQVIVGLAVVLLAGVSFFGGIMAERHFFSAPATGPNRLEAVPPSLLEPAEGAVLKNGNRQKGIPPVWVFRWSEVPGAERYHLHVVHEHNTIPIINDWSDEPQYQYVDPNPTAIIPEEIQKGWRWRVKAQVGGRWSRWSEVRTFAVEAPVR
jgi:hypothetical protein